MPQIDGQDISIIQADDGSLYNLTKVDASAIQEQVDKLKADIAFRQSQLADYTTNLNAEITKDQAAIDGLLAQLTVPATVISKGTLTQTEVTISAPAIEVPLQVAPATSTPVTL